MATFIKSTELTNVVATPQVINSGDSSQVFRKTAVIDVGTADLVINSIWFAMELPWHAKIKHLRVSTSADMDSNGSPALAIDIGIYTQDLNGTNVVVDANCYAAASTAFQSAIAFPGTDFAASAKALTALNQTIATDSGLSPANPAFAASNRGAQAVLALTVNTAAATAVASKVYVDVEYGF